MRKFIKQVAKDVGAKNWMKMTAWERRLKRLQKVIIHQSQILLKKNDYKKH